MFIWSSGFIPKSAVQDVNDLRLSLKVRRQLYTCVANPVLMTFQINGETKQNGTTGDMIFKIPRLIEHISSIMTLEVRADLILNYFCLTRYLHLFNAIGRRPHLNWDTIRRRTRPARWQGGMLTFETKWRGAAGLGLWGRAERWRVPLPGRLVTHILEHSFDEISLRRMRSLRI